MLGGGVSGLRLSLMIIGIGGKACYSKSCEQRHRQREFLWLKVADMGAISAVSTTLLVHSLGDTTSPY